MTKNRKNEITKAVVAWEANDKQCQKRRARLWSPELEWSYVLTDLNPGDAGDTAKRAAKEIGISLEELEEWAHDIWDRYFNG